ncbi:MAG: expansin EXLX1 family cellulose-binding protein [Minicystis sp.]
MRTLTSALVLVIAPVLFAACSEALPAKESAAPPPPAAPAAMTAAPAAPPAPLASAAPAPVPAPPPAAPAASAAPSAEPAAAPPPKAAEVHRGEAVFYDSHARGSCSLTFHDGDDVLSAPRSVYNQIQGCGQCLEITGEKGTAVAKVVDQCFDCPQDRLVLNKPTFEKVVGLKPGNSPISWKVVPCGVTGNLAFLIKKTSSQYWTAIQVRNHRVAIKGMAFKKGDGWQEMTRSNDNYFVAEKGVGTGPLTLRVTAVDGQTFEQTFDTWKDGTTVEGKGQFK